MGHADEGYKLRDGVPLEIKDPGHAFTLRTPNRAFHLASQSMQEKMDWMEILRSVLSTPLTPQDISDRARLQQR